MARYLLPVRRNAILLRQSSGSLPVGTAVVSENWFEIVGKRLLQRWVNTHKVLDDRTVTSMYRLVARRFQEADKDSMDTANPTMNPGVWRVMVGMTAVYV